MNDVGNRKIRVLLAKVGLDGHDRGIKTVARYLADAGMEVIFTGIRSTPEQIVDAAVEEDVDVVGLSFLGGDHMTLAPRVIDGLRRRGLQALIVLGGIIPQRDIPALEQTGAARVFLPGTPPDRIVQFIRGSLEQN
ncbi:MAG: methylmalonyl-CoA mutase [Betaproteobacteria bacterium RBG_16_64_18]|nr:MAG: methylmalonyl-CoA mutase [Betaproteobacteria bacterium RBG_16_64_18]OGA41081.1 MAG: methylmalonyl-CoA mutase [Betaproteobacteria bacterium RIFCSPLOWO2_12_FULL_65_110]